MTEARAIVFDLDDTLYPYRLFLLSAFQLVASSVEQDYGVPAVTALRTLKHAHAHARGYELQYLCAATGLPVSLVPPLRDLVRQHMPSLRLPQHSARVLMQLRRDWRVGVLTNGDPPIQARKIAALGLTPLVDTIVFATACGDGRGKPAADGFREVLRRLGTTPDATVFVGDDPTADVAGAARIGMKTIYLRPRSALGRSVSRAIGCDASVDNILAVPAIASQLVPVQEHAHVA